MHYNDHLLDIMHISNKRKIFKNKKQTICLTGSSTRAKQGVQNQYSDGDDESDDLSSNVSAL